MFFGLHVYFSYNSFIHCQHSEESLKSYIFCLFFLFFPSIEDNWFCPSHSIKMYFCKDTNDDLVTDPVEKFQLLSCLISMQHVTLLTSPEAFLALVFLTVHSWISFYFSSVLCLLSLKCSLNVDVCLSVPLAFIY